jgi:hypothetical protein
VEDAWPTWITEQFPSARPAPFRSERLGHQRREWPARRPELRVKQVCRTCNNGWMSRLETSARPYLQPLLTGTPAILDYLAQSSIAVWAVKTAMVIEGLELASQRRYSQKERTAFAQFMVIPPRTVIWLASLPDVTLFYTAERIQLDQIVETRFTAITFTIGLARLALQVMTMRVPLDVDAQARIMTSVRPGRWNESTAKIWPADTVAVRWPLSLELNGEPGLDELANRFSVTGMPRRDLQELAV